MVTRSVENAKRLGRTIRIRDGEVVKEYKCPLLRREGSGEWTFQDVTIFYCINNMKLTDCLLFGGKC